MTFVICGFLPARSLFTFAGIDDGAIIGEHIKSIKRICMGKMYLCWPNTRLVVGRGKCGRETAAIGTFMSHGNDGVANPTVLLSFRRNSRRTR